MKSGHLSRTVLKTGSSGGSSRSLKYTKRKADNLAPACRSTSKKPPPSPLEDKTGKQRRTIDCENTQETRTPSTPKTWNHIHSFIRTDEPIRIRPLLPQLHRRCFYLGSLPRLNVVPCARGERRRVGYPNCYGYPRRSTNSNYDTPPVISTTEPHPKRCSFINHE